MFYLYNFLTKITNVVLHFMALFSPKMKLFVNGRKTVWATLSQKINPEDQTIWFHAASLGEYEQGLPVMEAIKNKFPTHKIVLSFFSPSGYEVRKNNTIADVTVYLPLDTKANSQRWLSLIHPSMVFFIKYEFWPNYLYQLKKSNIKTFLISGIFRENQAFFKWYGGFYRNALKSFDHFFVQNESSKKLIQNLGFHQVSISGDTRFDRVSAILNQNHHLPFVTAFKNEKNMIVIGSSWPKDEQLLAQYINQNPSTAKYIIAPHNIKTEQIDALETSLNKKIIRYSAIENPLNPNPETLQNLTTYDVLIIDTIGLLTKIYAYADIAYVGGGFGQPGVHNILEPATYGIPIVLGPNYSHFAEATALVGMGGCISISDSNELTEVLTNLLQNEDERHEKGHIAQSFVQMNTGATQKIIRHILN